MLKAIVFDLDGVIIDSEHIHAGIVIQVMRDFGGQPTVEEIYEFVGITDREMWGTLCERHKLNGTIEQLLERHHEYKMKRFLSERVPVIDGMEDLMKSAGSRGLKIGLATSSPGYFAKRILENAGLMHYFDALVTSDDVKQGKPDPEIYLKAAETLNVEPGCCIAVEDAFFGIQAAKSAGMKVIAFRNPNSGNQDTSRADFVVSSIRSIDLDELTRVYWTDDL